VSLLVTAESHITAPICPSRKEAYKWDLAELVSLHGKRMLADAAAIVRAAVDPLGLNGRGFHVVDTATLGIDTDAHGIFYPELYPLVRHHLPVTARPGPTVLVNCTSIMRAAIDCHGHRTAGHITASATALACLTAAHEYCHSLVSEIHGSRLPAGVSLSHVVEASSLRRPTANRLRGHGPRWCRTFAHAMKRCGQRYGLNITLDHFIGDLEGIADGRAIIDYLGWELATTSEDVHLQDVARSPVPKALKAFFQSEEET